MPAEPTRWVIVDDTSADIEYIGSWSQDNSGSQDHIGNFGPTFNATSHYTTTSAILRYKFKGTRIYVVGTNNVRNDSGVINPSWECDVDAKSITANVPKPGWWVDHWVNNWGLCESHDLEDREHILTLYAKSLAVRPQALWFDQIRYLPSPSVLLDHETIYVDPTDPALNFSDGWSRLATNLSSNVTNTGGSELNFEFYGISLSWYGTLWDKQPTNPTTASYSVDGQNETSFALKGLPLGEDVARFNEKTFETPTYPAGHHILNVKYQGDAQSVPLVLDYLIVQNGTAATIASSGANNTGAIVGGVVGSVVFVILIILAFVIFRRKRNNKRLEVDPPYNFAPVDISSPQTTITPFPSEFAPNVYLDTHATAEHRATPNNGPQASKLAAYSAHFPAPVDGQQSSDSTALIGRRQISRDVLSNLSPSASRIILGATDSGIRLPRDDTVAVPVELLPPQYTYN